MMSDQLSAISYQLIATTSARHPSDRGLGTGLWGLGIAFLVCTLLAPLGIRLARRLGVIDRPRGDKIHLRPTPLMGGAAIAVAFFAVALWLVPLYHAGRRDVGLTGLYTGCALAALLGVVDELRTLKPRVHVLGQVAVALVAWWAGFPLISHLRNPLTPAGVGSHDLPILFPLGLLFTIFWIVGMMNTVNFLDGLDGLAGGVTAIAALFLGLWEAVVSNTFVPSHLNQNVILPLILCGAITGFLIYNWAPARVFMGDSGAMFIGFSLGALSLFGTLKFGTALLILIVPIIDVAWAIVRRLLGRRSFASGDKHHIYHRMLELGLSRRTVVLLFYALCIAFGLIDLNVYGRGKLVAFAIIAALAASGAVALEVRGRRVASRAAAPGGDYRHRPSSVE